MRAHKEWSLASRITRGFAVTCTALCLIVLGFSFLYVRRSVERQIAALATEELDEMRAYVPRIGAPSVGEFDDIASRLGEDHPANPFAWRIWKKSDHSVWHTSGDQRLLRISVPLTQAPGETVEVAHNIHWTTSALNGDLIMGLLIDATEQQRILSRYTFSGLIGITVATLLAALGGGIFARRVGQQLDQVARGLRAVSAPSQSLDLRSTNPPSEIRQVAESLEFMLQNIRAESESARLITAGLAHELRAPIQNMLGEAEVGLLRTRSHAEYRAILESQLEELRDLGRVVDNLVTLTSVGRNAKTRPTEHFDIGKESRLRLSRELAQANKKGVRLNISTRGNLEIDGDREALILAIRNLVGNAIQWSDAAGEVDLSIAAEGNSVLICIDDQGPGVPSSERKRIFEAFVTTRAVNGKRMGYGLGLALAKSAVDSHGGTIRVESAPSGGARFRLRLAKKPAA